MSFKFNGKKTGLFAAGVLFGTAGLKVLSSDDAKKFYTNCSSSSCKEVCDEDCDNCSGELW